MKRILSLVTGVLLSLILVFPVNASSPTTSINYKLTVADAGTHNVAFTATLLSGSLGSVQNAVIEITCYFFDTVDGGIWTPSGSGVSRVTWVGNKIKTASASFTVQDSNCGKFTGAVYQTGNLDTLISNVVEGFIP